MRDFQSSGPTPSLRTLFFTVDITVRGSQEDMFDPRVVHVKVGSATLIKCVGTTT